MEKESPKQMEINLREEVSYGIYSNLAIITHSDSEFVMDFVSVMPGMKKGEVRSRVIVTPQNAKRLLTALAENIRKFEEMHGVIQEGLHDNTIPILGSNGGLA